MELHSNRLTLTREPSELDRAVVDFTSVLDDEGVEYVIVSGYVAILTGRARSTEDVDTVLEPLSEPELDRLADRFDESGYWGMAMPLSEMASTLVDGDRLRVAEEDTMYPNFEVWLASNDLEREALSTSITADLDGHELSISSIELQIAYKLRLAADTGTTQGKDFEDALHLYLTFEDQFNREELEAYVDQLGVEDHYAELRRA